jgi:hypothetical protein
MTTIEEEQEQQQQRRQHRHCEICGTTEGADFALKMFFEGKEPIMGGKASCPQGIGVRIEPNELLRQVWYFCEEHADLMASGGGRIDYIIADEVEQREGRRGGEGGFQQW